ncbi:MAG: OmpH family outer membrane protein [Bacteroidales bacterium]|nr:OmpH family outer membrane protein [Bacteroidales bacterium]
MKKIVVLGFVACLGLLTTGFAQSQKFAHVNSQEVLQSMPGVDSINIKLQAFQQELRSAYEEMMNDYQAKREKFDKEAGTMSQSVRQMREKEITDLERRIQEFQSSVQVDLEQKQYDLAKPFQDKIQNAISEVAKDGNYTYIFDKAILLYSDGGVDITPMVKKKLGIKL